MVFVLLTGGEPFVRKDFFEIYGAMKKMGLLISINSNGSMLSGEIRQKLLEDPPFRINISLYGGCSETYRRMCGAPAFDSVVENIRALKEAGVDVRINLSITQYNRQDLEKIWKISQELGVHVKAASYMYPPVRINGGHYGCGNRLTPEEAAACSLQWDKLRLTADEMDQRSEALHNLMQVDEPECPSELEEGIRCRAGSSAFWMTWDGRMLPCGMMPYPVVYPLQTGFRAAWAEILRQTRALRMPSQCGTCPKKDACAVCAAVCVTETGRFDGVPSYVCRMTEETIRQTWNDYMRRKEHCNDH
jgi:MoaA/NifB/PqqE/SkfB family radical SAM enzyme